MPKLVRSIVVVAALLVSATAGPPATSATAPVDADRLALSYDGGDWRLTRPLGYRWKPSKGSWSVTRAERRADGRLVLDVEMTPPSPGVPLDPGPATVFATLSLYGDAGADMGVEARIGRAAHVSAEPCRRSEDCELRAHVVLPTHRVGPVGEAVANAYAWYTLNVNLVLVRTFGRGRWVQVLPLEKRARRVEAGTLAEPETFTAGLRTYGAFDTDQGARWMRHADLDSRPVSTLRIAERDRRSGRDRSRALQSVPVHLDIDAGDCSGWTLLTRRGDVAFDEARRVLGQQHRTVRVPAGAEWYVLSPSFENIDMISDAVHTFGPFTIDGQAINLAGRWSCDHPDGALTAEPVPSDTQPDGAGPWCEVKPSIEPAEAAPSGADAPSVAAASATRALAGEWRPIAAAPIAGRIGHTAVWTGTEVVVWGGLEPAAGDEAPGYPVGGAAFDPRTDTWRTVSEAPILGRVGHSAVWTGTEMIVFGGRRGDRVGLSDGAAYAPTSDTWRPITRLEHDEARYAHEALWTGDRMLIAGGSGAAARPRDRGWQLLAFDPAAGRGADGWRSLVPPHFREGARAGMAWTGESIIAAALGRGHTATVAVYRPDEDRWYSLPNVVLSSRADLHPVVSGPEVLFLTPEPGPAAVDEPLSAAYDTSGSCWRAVADPPADHPALAIPVAGDDLVLFSGARGLAYQPSSDTWWSLPAEPRAGRVDAPVVWAGDRLFTWGGWTAAGGPALADGLTFTPEMR
jgi:hypothetical protein